MSVAKRKTTEYRSPLVKLRVALSNTATEVRSSVKLFWIWNAIFLRLRQ